MRIAIRRAFAAILVAGGLIAAPAFAATSVTITVNAVFPPTLTLVGTGLVDDGDGCDYVTVAMQNPGGVTDVDLVCLDPVSGQGSTEVDPGSFQSGYTSGPPLYFYAFNTVLGDACYNGENDFPCYDLLQTLPPIGFNMFAQTAFVPVNSAPALAATVLLLAALGLAALRRRERRHGR